MITQRLASLLFITTIVLSAPFAVTAECKNSSGSGNEVVGTLLGAALGGLVGSQIGGGSGNKIAIGAGVLAGGLFGNNIGRSLDCRDMEYHDDTAQSALETHRTGSTSQWTNPDTGHSGTVTPVETYQRADGVYCRDFEQTISVEGETELAQGTACRQDDGTWQVLT